MYARNTNDRSHPWAACRVDRETLVPGDPRSVRTDQARADLSVPHRGSPRVIAPSWACSGGDCGVD
jgi:hypothetical protein